MAAERVGVLGSILHVGRHRETSQVSVAAEPHKITKEEYLKMTLTQPYLMDGSLPAGQNVTPGHNSTIDLATIREI